MSAERITLRPWSDEDLSLLKKLMSDPRVMEHLGGPDSRDQILERHQRYLHLPETNHMYVIFLEDSPVGNIGYWETTESNQTVYEMGWMVLPGYQRRGIATRAAQLVVDEARANQRHRFMHAFPGADNIASNAICRKLNFSWIESREVEYPKGHWMQANNWRLDLFED